MGLAGSIGGSAAIASARSSGETRASSGDTTSQSAESADVVWLVWCVCFRHLGSDCCPPWPMPGRVRFPVIPRPDDSSPVVPGNVRKLHRSVSLRWAGQAWAEGLGSASNWRSNERGPDERAPLSCSLFRLLSCASTASRHRHRRRSCPCHSRVRTEPSRSDPCLPQASCRS